MAHTKQNEARLRKILDRQRPDKWGKDYVPSIFASPKEAPSLSEFSILTSAKLGGRGVHALSKPETWLVVLALYNPVVWELHEEKMLSPTPRPHFLHGHPRARGQKFLPLRGTLNVAERMGTLNRHPLCRIKVELDGGVRYIDSPFPYVGDLLLFLEDQAGVFVINWNVKDKPISFSSSRPVPGRPRTPNCQGTINRQALETTYYSDGDIPTIEIAGVQLDFELRNNLLELFGAHADTVQIPADIKGEITQLFVQSVGSRICANQLCRDIASRYVLDIDDVVKFLKQCIWTRKVRIDLFTAFLIDRPLRPELRDPLVVYSDWFARS